MTNFIQLGIIKAFQTVLKIYNLHLQKSKHTMIPPQSTQNPTDFKMENITREQLKKIEKSMKKPEFMGLLNEYMIEISDPKNKQQYDEYLRQMQREGQLPKNMSLVELTPHFCIRTSIVSEKNKKHNMKFFINYCSTQFLDEPVCQPSLNEEGKTAFGWKVPNSMGKIRYDQDKSGNPCQVADVAFNHKAFEIVQAQNNLPFRKNQFKSMIISIGLECAQKQLGQRKQTLSKDYDILKSLKCKGGKPALLPLRYIKGKAYNKGEGPQQQTIQRDTQGKQTKLQKQINQAKEKSVQEKKKQEQKAQEDEMQQQLEDKKVLVQDLDQGIQQPKYSSIYTYPIDYSQFLQDPSHMNAKKVPSHFTIEFKLPRVEGMEQIGGDALNINENRVVLKIGEKYFIDLPFQNFKMKYKITTDKVKAKFDKKKKCLKLIFPIDQSVKYHQEEQKAQSMVEQVGQQNNGQAQVVQNETWKNKVLQVTEPSVDLKIIEQNEVRQEPVQPPQKKLIEQIDEDDYPEQEKDRNQNNTNQKSEPQTFEQALQQQKNHAFTLRKYYQAKNEKIAQAPSIQQVKQKPNSLTYVFQETNDKVVLIIKMTNYKKEDVKVVYDQLENNNFFIEWNQNQPEQQDISKVHLLNFTIDQNHVRDIKKVQIVFRVNFLAIFFHKLTLNKFWEKEAIKTVQLIGQQTQSEYEIFKTKRDEIEQANNERAAAEKAREQEMRQKQPKVQNDIQPSKAHKNNQSQPPQAIQSTTEQNQNKIYEVDNEAQSQSHNNKNQQSSKLQGEYFNFNNLPPQFIQFDIKFVEAMD